MTIAPRLAEKSPSDDLRFLLANCIPRRLATRLMGWFSQIEHPLVARTSIAVWRLFADLDLSDARLQSFKSLHACFTRELKAGARAVDPDPQVMTSPCDGIVGASGRITGKELIQAKGFPYSLEELLIDPRLVERHIDGCYVTLRLTPSMYHRFHAPQDCAVEHVTYVSGDTWNVDPIALRRVAKLFCKNERAILQVALRPSGLRITLVPVAAILVASIRLNFLKDGFSMNYRGKTDIPCAAAFAKGEEIGWFEHGSTLIVLAPRSVTLCASIREGSRIRMGQPLMNLP